MHQNNNNIDAGQNGHQSADELRAQDPYLVGTKCTAAERKTGAYSESMAAAMDDLRGTSTSRRAGLLNSLK